MNTPKKNRISLAAVIAVTALIVVPHVASADENCCFNNFRFAGGCMVVARGTETCGSVLSYLNSFDAVGIYYCDNTTVRGGWTLSDCGEPAQLQNQPHTPQYSQPTEKIQQSQPSVRPVRPQTAPGARDANLLQVSAPLKVRFDSDLDTATHSAGHMVTGTLQEDLMDGDTLIAPAGSQVQAQLVPTSYWGDGSGDSFQVQATGIRVGENVIPINATAVQAHGKIGTAGVQVKVPEGSLVSFETAAADPAADLRPTLTAGGSRWMEYFNNHDAKSLAELYSEDAVLLPPNAPAVFGRDAIRASNQAFFATGDFKIEIEALETVIDGHLAYVAGRYRMWTEEGALVDRGKYVDIWRVVDGQWLLHREIYNSSVQPPETDDHDE